MDIWYILKTEPTRDRKLIRRAFIKRMRTVHPQRNLDAFELLRKAYEIALQEIHVELEPDLHGRKFEPTMGEPIHDDELAKDALQQAEHMPDFYLAKIIEGLDQEDVETAINTLDQVLKEPDFNNFHFLSQFEQSLQYALVAYVPFAIDLARHAMKIFDWQSDADRSLPAHLEAIHLMVAQDSAKLKREELEKLAVNKHSEDAHILKALLGPYRPFKFSWMTLSPENLDRMQHWLSLLEQEYPEVLDLELNTETIEWWQAALTSPHLSYRGILITASISSIFSLLCLGAANKLIPHFDNHPFTLASLFSVSFIILLGLSYFSKHLAYRLLEWQPRLRNICSHIGNACSSKFKSQLIMLPIFIMCFVMILFSDGLILSLFAISGYIFLLLIFGVSLFFFINFIALFVSIMLRNTEWYSQLDEITRFGLHSLSVLDVALVYFLLSFILSWSGGTLRAIFGIKHKPEVDQHLYNFILVAFALVINISLIGLPK